MSDRLPTSCCFFNILKKASVTSADQEIQLFLFPLLAAAALEGVGVGFKRKKLGVKGLWEQLRFRGNLRVGKDLILEKIWELGKD